MFHKYQFIIILVIKIPLLKKALVFYLDRVIDEYEAILEEDVPFAEKLKIIMDKKNIMQ